MGLPTVTINQLSGNSVRPLPGFDYYSGMIFYGTAPTVAGKWQSYTGTPTIKAQQIFGVPDATAAGIVPYSDNVASACVYTITSQGSTGDVISLYCTISSIGGITQKVLLCKYTVPSGDNTVTLQGAAITALINANTS